MQEARDPQPARATSILAMVNRLQPKYDPQVRAQAAGQLADWGYYGPGTVKAALPALTTMLADPSSPEGNLQA